MNWSPTLEDVKQWAEDEEILRTDTIHPCGCGIKLDLEEVVYPALKEAHGTSGLGERVDSAAVEGRLVYRGREINHFGESDSHTSTNLNSVQQAHGRVVAGLVSLDRLFYVDPNASKQLFGKALSVMQKRMSESSIQFTKAHTIEAGGNFVLFDHFDVDAASPSVFTYVNHDTIVTADSLLSPQSRLSVTISLCNALNDLIVAGAHRELRVIPVVGGSTQQREKMLFEMKRVVQMYRDGGVDIEVLDRPEEQISSIPMVGATVVGTSDKRATSFSGLQSGDVILVSRKVGDLSILAQHRSLWLEGKELPPTLRQLRLEVLSRMATPQFEIGELVHRHLGRGLTFVTDLSGPGLSVLYEAACASGVDVLIDDISFHDESYLHHYRRNHTSGTNGPILFACRPERVDEIEADLRSVGCHEVWRLGSVKGQSSQPTMILDPSLRRFSHEQNPRWDMFSPEVHFSGSGGAVRRRIPIFGRHRFREEGV